jgi:hypothetical protein
MMNSESDPLPRLGRGLCSVHLWLFLLSLTLVMPASASTLAESSAEWARLTKELTALGLPTRFLRILPTEFVKLEFADLKTAAAEYHPEDHRMVFNRALSARNEGRRFQPFQDISNQDLATIYHELFHAYFDYIDFAAGSASMPPEGARLYAAAKKFRECRYTMVKVMAGAQQKASQRRTHVEERRLSEGEGWEALNETWAVFVGWAIWNKLELTNRFNERWSWDVIEKYGERLAEAYEAAELSGYFAPADPGARQVVPRWYLAPANTISVPEMTLLLETILEEPHTMARLAIRDIASDVETC